MSVFLRLDDLFKQCLTIESLRRVLKKNDLSIIGDFEDKIERLNRAILAGDVRFREDFLHQISGDEIREVAYQLGFDTDEPLWKIKENILFWFDRNFDGLSDWEDFEHVQFGGHGEILNWIKTGSLGQIQKLCFYIENYLDDQGLLYEFSEFDTKEEGIQRLSGISPHILMEAAKNILTHHQKVDEEEEDQEFDLDMAYEVLGLSPEVNPGDLKKRYRELMKQWHPDSFGQHEQYDDQCLKRLHHIQNAFQKIKSVRPDIR